MNSRLMKSMWMKIAKVIRKSRRDSRSNKRKTRSKRESRRRESLDQKRIGRPRRLTRFEN